MELWVGVSYSLNVEGVISDMKSSENIVSEKAHSLGWKPVWNKDRFLQNIDDEIQDVVELGKAKSSLMDSLSKFAKG